MQSFNCKFCNCLHLFARNMPSTDQLFRTVWRGLSNVVLYGKIHMSKLLQNYAYLEKAMKQVPLCVCPYWGLVSRTAVVVLSPCSLARSSSQLFVANASWRHGSTVGAFVWPELRPEGSVQLQGSFNLWLHVENQELLSTRNLHMRITFPARMKQSVARTRISSIWTSCGKIECGDQEVPPALTSAVFADRSSWKLGNEGV